MWNTNFLRETGISITQTKLRPRSLPPSNLKYFLLHTSHQIFRRMHGALNVGKKDN
jgi:hypothetical protein